MARVEQDRWIRWALLITVVLLAAGFVAYQNWPRWELAKVAEVRGERDSRTLNVAVMHSDCGTKPRVAVRSESAIEVVLRAEKSDWGDCNDIALTTELVVELDVRIGERTIRLESLRPGATRCQVEGIELDPCE